MTLVRRMSLSVSASSARNGTMRVKRAISSGRKPYAWKLAMFSTSSVVNDDRDLILRAGAAAQLLLLLLAALAAEADAIDGAAPPRHLLEAGERAGGDEGDVAPST